MNIEYFETNLVKLGIQYDIQSGCNDRDIVEAQLRLKVEIPTQVKLFYKNVGGLQVDSPRLKILPLSQLVKCDSKAVFCSQRYSQLFLI